MVVTVLINCGGQCHHAVYEKLGFIPIKVEHKNSAKCSECKVTKNTAKQHLKAHRKFGFQTAKAIEPLLQPSLESSSYSLHQSDSEMTIHR